LLDILQTFCVDGRADRTFAIRQADAEKWSPMPKDLRDEVGHDFPGDFDGRILSRPEGTFVLAVGDATFPGAQTVTMHLCLVGTTGKSPSTVDSVRNWLGFEPIQRADSYLWPFTTKGGRRVPAPTESPELMPLIAKEQVEVVAAAFNAQADMLAYGITFNQPQ
jgi:hypothetical protein